MIATFFERQSYDLTVQVAEEMAANKIPCVLIGEHPPMYTRGRRSTQPAPRNDIPVIDVPRGGDMTYHGPGQLCAHIVAPWTGDSFTRAVERAVIFTIADEDVWGEVREEYPGVWVGGRKIASLGFRVVDGWTVGAGGVSLNVSCDLAPFEAITPCGIEGVQMTSLALETGRGDFPGLRGRLADRILEAL